MYIAIRDRQTGFTAIKDHVADKSEFDRTVRSYTTYPKDRFDFWMTSEFFKPWTNRLYAKSSSNTTPAESVFEQTTIGSNFMTTGNEMTDGNH